MKDQELIFVYLGKKLPAYARDSMILASKHSGMKIHLLGSGTLENQINLKIVKFTPIESFYNQSLFADASKRIWGNHEFRNGFWLKSLERLFVLEQFMKYAQLDRILHAELDQVFFRIDVLADNLAQIEQRGIFLPFHTEKSAVASVIYCNDLDSLSSLVSYSRNCIAVPNEMALIANWARENQHLCHQLPTLASEINFSLQSEFLKQISLHSDRVGGIVDAAQLGQWVGGIDPRNVPINARPRNKYVDQPIESLLRLDQLDKVHFLFDKSSSSLIVEFEDKYRVQIFNLHIHSKIHQYLNSRSSDLTFFFSLVNMEKISLFPGTRKVQISDYLLKRFAYMRKNPWRVTSELFSRLNSFVNRRPSSEPFLSGDSFRSIANSVWESNNQTLTPENIGAGDIVFCESELLPQLKSMVLVQVKKPFVLILGNSDFNHTDDLSSLLLDTSVTQVWAQNMVQQIPMAEPLPIGLENAWRSNHGRTSRYKAPIKPREVWRIFAAFNVGTNLDSRSLAANVAIRAENTDHFGQLTPRQHAAQLRRYAFVLSPEGNGIDTHRTWEAMYLGSIPIVTKSYMTQRFRELKLPMWVVDSFEEILDFNQEMLEQRYNEIIEDSIRERLFFGYWKNRILNSTSPVNPD